MHIEDQTHPSNLIQHYDSYLVGFIFRNYPPGDSDSSYIQKALKSAVNAHIHWDNICTRSGTALYIKELPTIHKSYISLHTKAV